MLSETVPHSIRIESFFWNQGPSSQPVFFMDGLNILHGRSQAERTILLRLIRYALGSKPERIDQSVLRASENVELKVRIAGEQVTFTRSCQHPYASINVVDSHGAKDLTRSEVSRYLVEKLNWPIVYLQARRPDGSAGDDPLSFSDLSRAFVVDRDISYSSIMAGAFDRKVVETVKVMLGLTTREVALVENQIRALDVKVSDLHQTIRSVMGFLATLSVPSRVEIESERARLSAVLEALREEERRISVEARNAVIVSQEGAQSSTYEALRDELLLKRAEYDDFNRDMLNLFAQTKEKSDLRAMLVAETQKLQRYMASDFVISTFYFTQCPRCMQGITDEMNSREGLGHCALCDRPLRQESGGEVDWEKALRDTQQTISETDVLLQNYASRRDRLEIQVSKLHERIGFLESELQVVTTQYVAPFVERMRLLATEQMGIERNLSELDYQLRQRNLATRYEEEDLPRAQRELESAQRQLTELKDQLGLESDYYGALVAHFRDFLDSIDLDQPVMAVDWDRKKQLPMVNGQSYKILIGFDLVVAVLAFHYALLAAGIRLPNVRTGHPGLLIIDEPDQQKMGRNRYQQILAKFAQLPVGYPGHAQIIVTAESADIPPGLATFAIAI